MTKDEMNTHLQNESGIGTICTLKGKPRYNFYPDTLEESGISRAMRLIYPLLRSGDIDTVTFVEQHKEVK